MDRTGRSVETDYYGASCVGSLACGCSPPRTIAAALSMYTDLTGSNQAPDQPGASRHQPRSQLVRAPRQSAFTLQQRPQSGQLPNMAVRAGYKSSSRSKAAARSSSRHQFVLADDGERTAQRRWDALPSTRGLLPGAEPAPAPQPAASAIKAGWLLRSHNDHSATHRQWKRQWVRRLIPCAPRSILLFNFVNHFPPRVLPCACDRHL